MAMPSSYLLFFFSLLSLNFDSSYLFKVMFSWLDFVMGRASDEPRIPTRELQDRLLQNGRDSGFEGRVHKLINYGQKKTMT